MIRKQGSSYFLYSKDGSKKLGGPYNTRAAAEQREKQVNYFKAKSAGKIHAAGGASGKAARTDQTPTREKKVSKATANYTDGPVRSEPCNECSMFITPDACMTVKGHIEELGHCQYFEPAVTKEVSTNAAQKPVPRVDYIGVQAFSAKKPKNGFRTEKLHNREYIVVPVTALVEGVIQGVTASTPELALASEFGKFPQGWNGRPVVVDHPEMVVDNQAFKVSANSPTILEKYQIGYCFNSKLDGKALKTEAWIDTQRAASLNDMSRWVLDTLRNMGAGEAMEVSTGLFTGTENHPGKYNGSDYSAIWSGVVPDHLAFLPEGALGACSVADGCGAGYTTLRANFGGCGCSGGACNCGGSEMTGQQQPVNLAKGNDDDANDETASNNANKKSKSSKSGAAAGNSTAATKNQGVDYSDHQNGRSGYFNRAKESISNFVARMNAGGKPYGGKDAQGGKAPPYKPDPQNVGPAEKLKMTPTGQDNPNNAGSMTSWFSYDDTTVADAEGETSGANDKNKRNAAVQPSMNVFEAAAKGTALARILMNTIAESIQVNLGATDDLMDNDVRSILSDAISLAYPNQFAYVIGFTPTTVIYCAWDTDDGSFGTFQVSFEIDGDKNVKFSDDCQEVRLTTQITPIVEAEEHDFGSLFDNAAAVADHMETNAMNPQEARKFLVNFGHTEAALKAMTDEQVLKLHAGVAATLKDLAKNGGKKGKAAGYGGKAGNLMEKDSTDVEDQEDDDMTGKNLGDQDAPNAMNQRRQQQQQQSFDDLLANASPDLRESIQAGMRMHSARKDELIRSLQATKRCDFPAEELKTFSIERLESLARLAAVPQDFGGLNNLPQPRLQSRSTGFAPRPPSIIALAGRGKSGTGNLTKDSGEGEGEGEFDGTGADSSKTEPKKKKSA